MSNVAQASSAAAASSDIPARHSDPDLHGDQAVHAGGTAPAAAFRKYLAYFLHRHLAFRLPEVEALAAMHGVRQLQWELPHNGNPLAPFWHVWLPDDGTAEQIAGRTVLLKVTSAGDCQGMLPPV